jgi:hypothetical protein
MKESALVRRILTALNVMKGCAVVKAHGSIYSTRGEPDLHGCYQGHAFFIEVKRPGGRATPLQMFRLDVWAKAGARVGIATSVEEALEIVRGE